MKTLMRGFASTLVVCLASSTAFAEDHLSCSEGFADERMTLVVPNAPGGGYDTYARAIAPVIAKHSGTQVRVVNMPAAGGQAARNLALNADPDELILLIENTTDLVITETSEASATDRTFLIEGFDVLGIVHVAEVVWVGQTGLDLLAPNRTKLIGADGTLEEAVFSLFMPAMALGLQSDLVTGYEGTNDQASGVLRGEVDVMSVSVTSGLRVAGDDDLDVVLALSNGPAADAPSVPYLAGEGSLTWQLTEYLDDAEKENRRGLAQAVADLRSEARGLHMTRNVPQARRDCMGLVIAEALQDAEFVDTAVSQGRPVLALQADEARQLAASMTSSIQDVISLSDAIVAERSAQ